MQFENKFTLAGQLTQKRTAEKNGNVWGYFFGIAGLGSTVEVRVEQAEYEKHQTGVALAIKGRIEQRGYNINLISQQVAPLKGAAAA